MVFYWSLGNSKSPQVSGTLSILADLVNAVVWMVSTRVHISSSSSPCTSSLLNMPSAPITIGITVTYIVFGGVGGGQLSNKVTVLISLFVFFHFNSVVCQSSQFSKFSDFCWLSLSLVVWCTLNDQFVSQNPKEFCASHSLGRIPCYAYTTSLHCQI